VAYGYSPGHSATVRSHRRGGPRRRGSAGPWVAIAVVVALVGGGLSAGYVYLVGRGCSGESTATVVVAPRIATIMRDLAGAWTATQPNIRGKCGRVDIQEDDSAVVANELTGDWDTKTEGPEPDIWVPESSAWVRRASVDADAELMMPDLQPSLARTPTVIAMPKAMADAAGMTDGPLTWQQIIDRLGKTSGWSAYKHADWGPFRIGLSDPQSSTAGLLALMAISDTNDDGAVDQGEKATLLDLKKVIKLQVGSTTDILTGLTDAAGQSATNAMRYVSAFPALEQDVLDYNLNHPVVPLVAIYPQDGTAEADFPYLILNAPWSQSQRQQVGSAFLHFLRSATGKRAFLDAGLRDSNRVPGKELVATNGVATKITALPRAILLPDSVQDASATWTAITRPTNVLLVFDTSGSMGGVVRGTGKSRLDLTKKAAIGALDLLDDGAQVGIWAFSTQQGGKDYRRLLDLSALGNADGGVSHRQRAANAINGLQAGGNTGLYNTIWAAEQEVQRKRVDAAANLVVLLTDGANDNNVAVTLSLNDLLNKLRAANADPANRVPVITIGLGTSSDNGLLRQISLASHGATYSSPTAFDISQVMLTALFSRT
jgi:Ca-activated chloride channel family protein